MFPSLNFDTLLAEVVLPDDIREMISNLAEKKKSGAYLGMFNFVAYRFIFA